MAEQEYLQIPVRRTSKGFIVHPEVTVFLGNLRGPEGNAYVVLGRVAAAMRKAKIDPSEYLEAAKAKNYQHLLNVTRCFVNVIEVGEAELVEVD